MFIFSKFVLLFNKLLLILFILAKFSLSHAEQLKIENIKINGAKRISDSFILNFLPEYPNTKFNNEVLNKFLQFFSNFLKSYHLNFCPLLSKNYLGRGMSRKYQCYCI